MSPLRQRAKTRSPPRPETVEALEVSSVVSARIYTQPQVRAALDAVLSGIATMLIEQDRYYPSRWAALLPFESCSPSSQASPSEAWSPHGSHEVTECARPIAHR